MDLSHSDLSAMGSGGEISLRTKFLDGAGLEGFGNQLHARLLSGILFFLLSGLPLAIKFKRYILFSRGYSTA